MNRGLGVRQEGEYSFRLVNDMGGKRASVKEVLDLAEPAFLGMSFDDMHEEVRGAQVAARRFLRAQFVPIERKKAEACAQFIQIDAGIEQRPDDHVSADAGKTVEIERAH
jgi:hypothetical protein